MERTAISHEDMNEEYCFHHPFQLGQAYADANLFVNRASEQVVLMDG